MKSRFGSSLSDIPEKKRTYLNFSTNVTLYQETLSLCKVEINQQSSTRVWTDVCCVSNLFLLPAATLKVNETVDTVRKLCLSPSSYVTDEWPGTALIGLCESTRVSVSLNFCEVLSRVCSSGESAAAAFRDLRKLSRVFKDQLAYPLIAAAREGRTPLTAVKPPSDTVQSGD